jgi:small-conductance mechanosensitive channel
MDLPSPPAMTRVRNFILSPKDLSVPTRLFLLLLSLAGLLTTAARAPAYYGNTIYDDGLGSAFCTLSLILFSVSLTMTLVLLTLTYFLHQPVHQQPQQYGSPAQRKSEVLRGVIITLDILVGLAMVALVVLTGLVSVYGGMEAALMAAYAFAVLVMVGHVGFVVYASVEARRAVRRRGVARRMRRAGEEGWDRVG